jgi:tripartite-type tricarboxylate transporter receptor subunit TctC
VIASAEIREQFALQGAEPASATPAEFRKAILDELVAAGKLVQVMGLKAE